MTANREPLRVERTPDRVVLSGEIDAHTAAVVRDALSADSEAGDLVVDLSGVTFIDSSGLRVLLTAHEEFDQSGRRLVLAAPSKPVVRLIEVAGLNSYLHTEPALGSDGDQAPGDDDADH